MVTQPLFFSFRPEARRPGGRLKFGFLWRPGPPLTDARLDEEGMTAPGLTFGEGQGVVAVPRTIKWSQVKGLQLERGVYGEISLVFAGPDDPRFLGTLRITRSDLVDPDGFQRAVESLCGRRFEATFEEARPEESGPVPPSPLSAGDEAFATDLAAGSVTSKSFRVRTVWGKARATVLGLLVGGAVFTLLHFFAPAAIAAVVTSALGFALFVVAGMLLGEYWISPRLGHYRLIAAPDGLYATVPSRRFPRFTPWHELRDFTLTDGKVRSFRLESGSRTNTKPPRRVTLFTAGANSSFECAEIENEEELAVLIMTQLVTERAKH